MDFLRSLLKLALVLAGIIAIYIGLSNVIAEANKSIRADRDIKAGAVVVASYVSHVPFGPSVKQVHRDSQIFYNLRVHRNEGEPCFVRTSWRWVLHHESGNTVMWNKSDGEFYAGDGDETLAQSVQVPAQLLPGDYTLSRLSTFKCGNVDDYARSVRNTDLRVE